MSFTLRQYDPHYTNPAKDRNVERDFMWRGLCGARIDVYTDRPGDYCPVCGQRSFGYGRSGAAADVTEGIDDI